MRAEFRKILVPIPPVIATATSRLPSEWLVPPPPECSKDVRSCRYQRNETLCTSTGSEYSKGYAES